MRLISEKCPNCGGQLQPGGDSAREVCPYCGSRFILPEALGKVSTAEPPALGGVDSEPGFSSIMLVSVGPKKLNVVKVIREVAGLDLAGAMKIVDSTPALVKRNVSPEETEAIRKKFDGVGSRIEIRRF